MVAFNDKKKSTVPSNDKGFGRGSSINENMPVSPNLFGGKMTDYKTNVKSEGGSPMRKPEQPKSIKTMGKAYPAQVPMRGGSKSKVGMPQSKNVATIKKISGKKRAG
jgi:hypothetical protein